MIDTETAYVYIDACYQPDTKILGISQEFCPLKTLVDNHKIFFCWIMIVQYFFSVHIIYILMY